VLWNQRTSSLLFLLTLVIFKLLYYCHFWLNKKVFSKKVLQQPPPHFPYSVLFISAIWNTPNHFPVHTHISPHSLVLPHFISFLFLPLYSTLSPLPCNLAALHFPLKTTIFLNNSFPVPIEIVYIEGERVIKINFWLMYRFSNSWPS